LRKRTSFPEFSYGISGEMIIAIGPAEGAKGNAFSKMLEQQRVQSRVHNFYLELTAQQTWRWHWMVTDSRTDAQMMAQLCASPQPIATPHASRTTTEQPPISGSRRVHNFFAEDMPLNNVEHRKPVGTALPGLTSMGKLCNCLAP